MSLDFIWNELLGRLWHTTHPDRFAGIQKLGAIVPEPDIPDEQRWKTTHGKNNFPYVRTLGGVSLFDFMDFDATQYCIKYPWSDWDKFVPFRKTWGCAVWIEIDRRKVAQNLISADDLINRRESEEAWRHTIMPRIEAAYIGELPQTAFVKAFIVQQGKDFCRPLPLRIA